MSRRQTDGIDPEAQARLWGLAAVLALPLLTTKDGTVIPRVIEVEILGLWCTVDRVTITDVVVVQWEDIVCRFPFERCPRWKVWNGWRR